MEKVYNGACMALPEKDVDLFERINERTARRRAEQERSEEEARQINEALLRKMNLYPDAESEELPRVDFGRLGGTVARLLLAAVFARAVIQGWCVPEFGLTGAALCVLWAAIRGRR